MSGKRSRRIRAERTALHALQLTRYIGQLFQPEDVAVLQSAANLMPTDPAFNGDTARLLSLATRIQTLIPPTHDTPPTDPPSPDRLPEPHGTPAD